VSGFFTTGRCDGVNAFVINVRIWLVFVISRLVVVRFVLFNYGKLFHVAAVICVGKHVGAKMFVVASLRDGLCVDFSHRLDVIVVMFEFSSFLGVFMVAAGGGIPVRGDEGLPGVVRSSWLNEIVNEISPCFMTGGTWHSRKLQVSARQWGVEWRSWAVMGESFCMIARVISVRCGFAVRGVGFALRPLSRRCVK